MIMNDQFLKKLRSAFDLNEYEAKIWTALLSKGVSAAGELSDIGDVPRSRSYDVLESLEKKQRDIRNRLLGRRVFKTFMFEVQLFWARDRPSL